MKRWHKAVIGAAIVTTVAIAVQASTSQRIGPANLYPNPALSPGLIATQSLQDLTSKNTCGTYSQCHRQTTGAMKTQVRAEYPNCPQDSEIDHILPLAVGGADDVKNLWCQASKNDWNGTNFGFHEKDTLEAFLASNVKSGHIAPKDAQDCIMQDWVKCFQKYIAKNQYFGAILSDPDNE